MESKNPHGDVGLVFGTMKALRESVEKAAELYQSQYVNKLLVSGGYNKKFAKVESDLMAKELVKLGVPDESIIKERKSTNTLENVLFSKDLLDKELGLENINTIVAVVKNYHSRRALMTIRKHFPQRIKLLAYPYICDYCPFTSENWANSDNGREKVIEELQKIEEYLAKGDIGLLTKADLIT